MPAFACVLELLYVARWVRRDNGAMPINAVTKDVSDYLKQEVGGRSLFAVFSGFAVAQYIDGLRCHLWQRHIGEQQIRCLRIDWLFPSSFKIAASGIGCGSA